MEKSYVSMGQNACIVCGTLFDTGTILMDKRLRDSMERKTVTGNGLCPEHKKLWNKGYIAFVEVDPSKSNIPKNGNMQPNDAYRTGVIVHLKKDVADQMLDVEITTPLVFAEPGLVKILKDMHAQAQEEHHGE